MVVTWFRRSTSFWIELARKRPLTSELSFVAARLCPLLPHLHCSPHTDLVLQPGHRSILHRGCRRPSAGRSSSLPWGLHCGCSAVTFFGQLAPHTFNLVPTQGFSAGAEPPPPVHTHSPEVHRPGVVVTEVGLWYWVSGAIFTAENSPESCCLLNDLPSVDVDKVKTSLFSAVTVVVARRGQTSGCSMLSSCIP